MNNENNNKNTDFLLHIGHPDEELSIPKKKETPKSKVKTTMENWTRQIVASLTILVILFLLINSSAYYKISKSKIQDYLGLKEQSPLHTLIDDTQDTVLQDDKMIVTTVEENIQSNQIPNIDLEVMPLSTRIVIPRIEQNVPIIRVSAENLINRDWKALENDMQEALRSGVVHYPGTSLPGDGGNVVITGHSSYFPWDPGRFKDVFALLHDVEVGDKVLVYYNQEKYIYEVDNIMEVKPTNIEVLKQTPSEQLTLITCTPVGTNLRRLIVTAKPIIENKNVSTKITR